MPTEPSCPNCRLAMEEGFLPDASYGSILETHWHPGLANKTSFLGMPTGTKIDRSAMRVVQTFRCPQCGLLQSYATDDNPRPA